MSEQAKLLLDEALQLTIDERAAMAARLLASMDSPADEGVETAWATEIEERARLTLAGETNGIDWEQARDQICERIAAGGASRFASIRGSWHNGARTPESAVAACQYVHDRSWEKLVRSSRSLMVAVRFGGDQYHF